MYVCVCLFLVYIRTYICVYKRWGGVRERKFKERYFFPFLAYTMLRFGGAVLCSLAMLLERYFL